MKLCAKITPKYFEEILSGKKIYEFRQLNGIDSIELKTPDGRVLEAKVDYIQILSQDAAHVVRCMHSDVDLGGTQTPLMMMKLSDVSEPITSAKPAIDVGEEFREIAVVERTIWCR
jgi:hypothetical protein